jgi:mono/diheme cytochrome c family protein
MFMNPRRPILTIAAAAALVGGCLIAVNEPAGSPCESRDDCIGAGRDSLYDCVAPQPGAQRVCQLIYPPVGEPDAGGVDAGPVTEVFWCNDVEALMATYCVSCHGEDRSGSFNAALRLDIYDDDTTAMPPLPGAFSKAANIKKRASDWKDMPTPGAMPQPTEEERARIAHWVRGGARRCGDGGM